jgi:hypothetical protein
VRDVGGCDDYSRVLEDGFALGHPDIAIDDADRLRVESGKFERLDHPSRLVVAQRLLRKEHENSALPLEELADRRRLEHERFARRSAG